MVVLWSMPKKSIDHGRDCTVPAAVRMLGGGAQVLALCAPGRGPRTGTAALVRPGETGGVAPFSPLLRSHIFTLAISQHVSFHNRAGQVHFSVP